MARFVPAYPTMSNAKHMDTRSMRLLLVDDHQDITRALKEGIEPAGHECVACKNPRKALHRFKKESFDAVICDFRMPELDGLQLLSAMREFKPGTPVVILTGTTDIQSAASAVDSGAFAFLQKPVRIHELLEMLSRIDRQKRIP
jgi:DNA-binding NtrC family response regulator